jgi:formyltetrahydrofolate deformylase
MVADSTAETKETFILTSHCRAATGVVAAVTSYLADRGCYICALEQFDDETTQKFFMRAVFRPEQDYPDIDTIRQGFGAVADRLGMQWAMRNAKQPTKTIILVSKFDHCLADLLYRHGKGDFNMDIVAVVAHHQGQ